MKLVKMSLLAATLVASSAFAIDNVKVSGDAKLFYSTNDGIAMVGNGADNDAALFRQENSAGQAGFSVGVTADLTEGVSAGMTANALSTLGLQNNLVSNVWEGTTVAGGNVQGLADQFWVSEAWIAGTAGKTTGKIGRMPLDTPLVFSETWSIAQNTFEAAVLLNQDIPDTTLVAAYVGGSNGSEAGSTGDGGTNASFTHVLAGGQDTANSPFHSFYQGAYAFGAVNNSWEPLTVQAWYFQAQHILSAYWLQADLALDMGIKAGVQYTGINVSSDGLNKFAGTTWTDDSTNSAIAAMVGYEMKDTFTVSAAFSQTGDDEDNGHGAGGNLAATGQSKLYTEAWWNYGYVTCNDTTAFNVTVTTPESLTWAELGLYVTQSTSTDGLGAGTDTEMTEVALSASKSFGPLDASLVYIMTDANDQNPQTAAIDSGDAYNTLQAYLAYNF